MATIEVDFQDLTPIECPICTDLLADPRALPCGHSYCGPPRKCLNGVQKKKCLKCAVCSEEFIMKRSQLKPLFGIRDFLEQLASTSSRSERNRKCFEVMCKKHPNNSVRFWCTECSLKACQDCFNLHHQSHAVIDFRKHLKEKAAPLLPKFKRIAVTIAERALDLNRRFKENGVDAEQQSVDRCLTDVRGIVDKWEDVANFIQNQDIEVNLNSVEWCLSQSFDDLHKIENELKMIKVSNFANFKFRTEFIFNCEKWRPQRKTIRNVVFAIILAVFGSMVYCDNLDSFNMIILSLMCFLNLIGLLPKFVEVVIDRFAPWRPTSKRIPITPMQMPYKRKVDVGLVCSYCRFNHTIDLITAVCKSSFCDNSFIDTNFLGRVQVNIPDLEINRHIVVEGKGKFPCFEPIFQIHDHEIVLPVVEESKPLLLKLQCNILVGDGD